MFSLHQRAIVGSLSLVTMLLGAVLPASAQTYQHAGNSNLWHVRHHIEFDIRNLQHDARDYHGYRDAAIQSLQHARNEILAGIEFSNSRPYGGFGGAADSMPGDRGQWVSNRNIWRVRHDIEREYHQLANDARDYGGHKGAAMQALQQARTDLIAGEHWARNNGYY